jgi:leucyl aminopeptidase
MTIQFSTKIFAQADLNNPKQLKASLSTLLAQSSDCLVLAYSKADLDALTASKSKSGLLVELDRLLVVRSPMQI